MLKKIIGPLEDPGKINMAISKKRSIEVEMIQLPVYRFTDLIRTICQYLHCNQQTVNSRIGLNIRVRQGMNMLQDQVGYLPTMNAPATLMNTVYKILKKALPVKDALHLQSVVIVLDQALYAKVLEIVSKYQTLFQSIVFRMGAFRTTRMFRQSLLKGSEKLVIVIY